MDHDLLDHAERYFRDAIGTGLEDLLSPIEGPQPTGENLRGQGVHRRIREARRSDAGSPRPGAGEPRRADWETVTNTAVEALQQRSKDLRLAAWLLEARLQLDGIAALPAGAVLLAMLCERYWDALHPEMVDDDPAYRTNIFDWLDTEATTILKLEPVTMTPPQQPDYTLADWERAVRIEQSRHRDESGREEPGVDTRTIAQAFAQTAADAIGARLTLIDRASRAIGQLDATLALHCGDATAGLPHLRELLGDLATLLGSELERRGSTDVPEPATPADAPADWPPPTAADEDRSARNPPAIRSRADAYACLALAAQYLASAEPHSPIPYVVNRTVEWGRMNAAELYRELFVANGGQLNVFELMGIAGDAPADCAS